MKAILSRLSTQGSQKDLLSRRSLVKLTLLLIFLASTAMGAIPQESAPNSADLTWDIYPVDAPSYFFMLTDRTLHFKSDGTPCAAYGGDHLYYSCYDSVGETWITEVVDTNLYVGSHAALAFNSDDKPYISYYDAENGDLRIAYQDFLGVWQFQLMEASVLMIAPAPPASDVETSSELKWNAFDLSIFEAPILAPTDGDPWDLEGDPGVGKFTSIAIDNLDGIHISYYDDATVVGSGRLKYVYWDGWSAPVISLVQSYHDQGDVGSWSSIVVDDEQTPHISYMSEKYDDVMYAYQRASGVWTIEQVDTGVVGPYTSIALDSRDRPHISYFDFGSKSLRHAYRRDPNDWFLDVVDSADKVGYFTSIAVDSDNEVHISYYDAANGNLKYAHTAFGDWTSWTKAVVDSEGDVGYYTSIALRNDRPSIFYFDLSKGFMKYARWNSNTNSWVKSTLNEYYIADVGIATSLALSTVGAPHISYMDDSRDYLKYAQTISTNWETSFVTRDVHAGSWSSIDMINDLQPAIAFYDMSTRDLVLAIRDPWDLKWEFEDVDTTGNVGMYVSLKVDSQGSFHISYYDATLKNLKYAFREKDADDWDLYTLDTQGTGEFTSIDLDPFDRPYISYYDERNEKIKVTFKSPTNTWVRIDVASVGDPNDNVEIEEAYTSIEVLNYLTDIHISYYNETTADLEYAYFNGAWNYETVDSTGDVGKYNSLAIHDVAPFTRHICYYDATNGDLKYASWDGVVWANEIVDSLGDVGRFCSIALNADGLPAISYYDDSEHDLMYATSFPLPDVQIHHVFVPIVMR